MLHWPTKCIRVHLVHTLNLSHASSTLVGNNAHKNVGFRDESTVDFKYAGLHACTLDVRGHA